MRKLVLVASVAVAVVVASAVVRAAQLRLQSAGLMAVVLDADGQPVSGAVVHVYPRHGGQRIRGAMTDDSGVARFSYTYTAPWTADVCAPYPDESACEKVRFSMLGQTFLPLIYRITLHLPDNR